jgi:uncharacterized protein YndB with AHSA1/START domain
VTFQASDGKTTLTLEARVIKTTKDADQYLDGMEEGWNQSFERLKEHLSV